MATTPQSDASLNAINTLSLEIPAAVRLVMGAPDNLDLWIRPLGVLLLNCGAIERLTFYWLVLLIGEQAADRLRVTRFQRRRDYILDAVRRATLTPGTQRLAIEAWESTRESFRVRDIVAHGGLRPVTLSDGTTEYGFAKLRDSTLRSERVLRLAKVEAEAVESHRVRLRLGTALGAIYTELKAARHPGVI